MPYGLAPRLKTKSRRLRKQAFVKVSTWKRGAKVGANIGPWRRDTGVQIDGHERSRALGGSLVQSLRLSRFISLFALLSFIPSFLPAAQGFPLHRLFRLQTRWVGICGTSLFNFLFLLLNPFCLNSCCLLDLRLMCLFAFFLPCFFFLPVVVVALFHSSVSVTEEMVLFSCKMTSSWYFVLVCDLFWG